jgi:hypothetical protein
MPTLNWNVKLLGNLQKQDFSVWISAAKIPGCYTFTVTNSADGWGLYPWEKESTIPIPDEGNTLIITGKDQYDLFEPYCFENHKCVMNTEISDYRTGTKILSTIMTSDGLLDKNVIESITDKVDMNTWIKKNHPEAIPCLSNMASCTDPTTGYLNDTDNAVKLENAICKYVLSSLNICKTPTGGNEIPISIKPPESQGISPMYYIMGAGAVVAAGLGWYLWKNQKRNDEL